MGTFSDAHGGLLDRCHLSVSAERVLLAAGESQITGIGLRDFYVITNRFQSIPPLSSTWLIEDETLYGLFTQRPLLNTHWPLLLYPQDKTNAKNRHRGQYCPFLPI